MKFRVSLLLGAAFVAGTVSAFPAAHWLGQSLVATAHAQDTDKDSKDTSQATPDTDASRKQQLVTLFGQVLDRVHEDYVDPVAEQKLVYNALNGMLSGLDPHSSYMDPAQWRDMQVETKGDFGGVGMQVTQEGGFVKVVSPIDDTPAARAGIRPNDLITTIDGKDVDGLALSAAVERLRGAPGTKVALTIKRAGIDAPVQVSLTREIIQIQVVKSHLYNDIGYVRLTEFNEEANTGLRKAVAELKKQGGTKLRALVLDLRDNPGGLLDQAIDISDDFLSSGEIVSTKGRHGDDDHAWYAQGNDITGGLPVVVLINEGTASASEIVSGALQDNGRAVLLGTRSFGKGSVQTVIPLEGDGAMRLTTARYYTPSGRSIQGQGVMPDVTVDESDAPQPQFGPAHESDLNNIISNSGGTATTPGKHAALPTIASEIPAKPPKDWPKFDPQKSATDFQLHEAMILARALAGEPQTTVHADTAVENVHAPLR